MKTLRAFSILIFSVLFFSPVSSDAKKPVRILVITGGHVYDKAPFNEMLASLGKNITCQVMEFPAAFDQFLPENWGIGKYKIDVEVKYASSLQKNEINEFYYWIYSYK